MDWRGNYVVFWECSAIRENTLTKMKYFIFLTSALIINHASRENCTLPTVVKIKHNLRRLPNIVHFGGKLLRPRKQIIVNNTSRFKLL
jgi:hypothetical protein